MPFPALLALAIFLVDLAASSIIINYLIDIRVLEPRGVIGILSVIISFGIVWGIINFLTGLILAPIIIRMDDYFRVKKIIREAREENRARQLNLDEFPTVQKEFEPEKSADVVAQNIENEKPFLSPETHLKIAKNLRKLAQRFPENAEHLIYMAQNRENIAQTQETLIAGEHFVAKVSGIENLREFVDQMDPDLVSPQHAIIAALKSEFELRGMRTDDLDKMVRDQNTLEILEHIAKYYDQKLKEEVEPQHLTDSKDENRDRSKPILPPAAYRKIAANLRKLAQQYPEDETKYNGLALANERLANYYDPDGKTK